jgi:hypothetical protein
LTFFLYFLNLYLSTFNDLEGCLNRNLSSRREWPICCERRGFILFPEVDIEILQLEKDTMQQFLRPLRVQVHPCEWHSLLSSHGRPILQVDVELVRDATLAEMESTMN